MRLQFVKLVHDYKRVKWVTVTEVPDKTDERFAKNSKTNEFIKSGTGKYLYCLPSRLILTIETPLGEKRSYDISKMVRQSFVKRKKITSKVVKAIEEEFLTGDTVIELCDSNRVPIPDTAFDKNYGKDYKIYGIGEVIKKALKKIGA